jgi:hypothetical protein
VQPATASRISAVRAFSTEPKLEYDSSAARGSMLKLRASAAVCFVTSASTAASGSKLTVVSAAKTTRPPIVSRYTPATYSASSAVPITCSGGRSAVG